MGQQQLLLIVLSVILVGIATTVGITMFQSYTTQSSIDALIGDLIHLGSSAYSYRIRPASLGGGSGTFDNFHNHFASLAADLRQNSNGTYSCEADYIALGGTHASIRGVSAGNPNIERWVMIAPNGTLTIYEPLDEETGGDDEPGGNNGAPGNPGEGRPEWAGGHPPWTGRP